MEWGKHFKEQKTFKAAHEHEVQRMVTRPVPKIMCADKASFDPCHYLSPFLSLSVVNQVRSTTVLSVCPIFRTL
mgnify:FL=1